MRYILLAVLLCFGSAAHALDITRHGITWTISDATVTDSGTYANGDPWVDANGSSITITAISPTPTAGRNGTVVNPGISSSEQGFDDRLWDGWLGQSYSETLNVGNNLPLSVAVDSSVVSCISTSSDVIYNQIDTYAVLTVVSSAPASNSFRPRYTGSGSRASNWTTADLNYDALADWVTSGTTPPSRASLETDFAKLWYEQDTSWTSRYYATPYMATNGYGKDKALKVGDACLLLNTDLSDANKQTLLIEMVQYGIDIGGVIAAGGVYNADGGHQCGRLAPVLLAAVVLDDATLKSYVTGAAMKFQELQVCFYVAESDVSPPGTAKIGANIEPGVVNLIQYSMGDVGTAEWGIRHYTHPTWDNNNWVASYRDISGSTLMSIRLLATALDAESVINWPALMDYADRHIGHETTTSDFASNQTPAWQIDMWESYQDYEPSGTTPTAPSSATATAIRQIGFDLTWTDNSDNETGFVIEWSYDGGSTWPGSATVAANSTSYSNRSQPPGQSITVRVRATNGAGDSSNATATAIATAAPAPVARPRRGGGSGIGGL
jgi:hypothetical protein